MKTSTIRPGLLVSLKTSIRGNISYRKRDVEADHVVGKEGKAVVRRAKWETERTIADAAEHEKASKVRTEAAYKVARVCATTAFGYLCPEERIEELESAMKEARELIAEFNSSAKITRLAIYMITGRVAPDDVEAVRAISAELRELVTSMGEGVKNLEADKIRDAAKRAKQVAAMLSDDKKLRVEAAIVAARKAATEINKAVKAGEEAAVAVDKTALQMLRTVYLDLDEAKPVAKAKAGPARALDLEARS